MAARAHVSFARSQQARTISASTSSTRTIRRSPSWIATPGAYGYTSVSPKEHREQVAGDFTPEEYLDLQRLVYRVIEAVREEVGAERMYLYTFGSNQGIAHAHWHVVHLPPGVLYEDQHGAWASWSRVYYVQTYTTHTPR
jgi:diadenosine tetraphosphate (Ap4A) HIT family hydrolase